MFRAFPAASSFRSLSVVLLACASPALPRPAWGADAEVVFDLPASVACRDVTPDSFAEANPDRRVFEARLEVSIRVRGDEQQIRQMTFEFASPERRWRVHDYYPRTTLESEFAEPICVTKTHEKSRTLGASLAAGLPVPLGPVVATVTPGVNGSTTGKDIVTESAKKIAPKRAVLVSGTLSEGHGVFFEWKPSNQDTWAGSRVHVIRFIAPAHWQGDWAQLTCRTEVATSGGMFKKSKDVHEQTRTVALYRAGSRKATLAAERLATAQSRYLEARQTESTQGKSLFGSRASKEWSEPSADAWRERMGEARRHLASLSGARTAGE